MQIIDNGLVDYEYADTLQRKLVSEKKKNPLQEDYLIFSEFNHVITLGRNVNESHILVSRHKLENLGIRVLKIDRGGDVTYHGPGQFVIYPIIDLKRQVKDIRKYIRNLEQWVIDFLAKYNLEGYRVEDKTGVWVQDKKIASIGIGISGWITYHGIGLNISSNLDYFDFIVPCGIKDKKMTSLKELTGKDVSMEEVKKRISKIGSLRGAEGDAAILGNKIEGEK